MSMNLRNATLAAHQEKNSKGWRSNFQPFCFWPKEIRNGRDLIILRSLSAIDVFRKILVVPNTSMRASW